MRALGGMIMLFGYLTTVRGWTIDNVMMILFGATIYAGSYYLGRR